jgi:hypothetical protein
MDMPGLADLMIAPLTLLEQSKGWKRRGLAFFYLMNLSNGGRTRLVLQL